MTVIGSAEMNATERISSQISCSLASIKSLEMKLDELKEICREICRALKEGNKVMTAGNGGSAAESLHFAQELSGRFRSTRKALPGMALTADVTAITCIGNDFGYEYVFSRQVEAFGKPGDVLLLFTTSGKSSNLLPALKVAKKTRMKVINLLGKDGGVLRGKGDHEIIVEGNKSEHIQEAHQVILHIILDAIELEFS